MADTIKRTGTLYNEKNLYMFSVVHMACQIHRGNIRLYISNFLLVPHETTLWCVVGFTPLHSDYGLTGTHLNTSLV